jgi:hypothetical protein
MGLRRLRGPTIFCCYEPLDWETILRSLRKGQLKLIGRGLPNGR